MGIVADKLPEDVLIQILLRLSVISLLRFKCISKAWCNLIKSSSFIAKQFNHPIAENDHQVLIKRSLQNRVTNVLSYHSNTESLNIVLPDLQIPHLDWYCLQVLGPCNGLVCFTNHRIIVLCNPAMREFKLVPELPFGCPQDMCCRYKKVGFGFDASTDDYKVVSIITLEDDVEYYEIEYQIVKVEVYQYSTNSWKEIDAELPDIPYTPCFEIFFHEATHLYAKRGNIQRILAFCITTEVFREFDFPPDCPAHKGKSLTVLNEFLSLLSYTNPRSRTHQQFIDFWMMREYGVSESWSKQFTIGPLSEIEHPLTSWKNSAILVQKTNGQLISCAIEKEEIKEFDIFGYPTTLRSIIYKGSLVSIMK